MCALMSTRFILIHSVAHTLHSGYTFTESALPGTARGRFVGRSGRTGIMLIAQSQNFAPRQPAVLLSGALVLKGNFNPLRVRKTARQLSVIRHRYRGAPAPSRLLLCSPFFCWLVL